MQCYGDLIHSFGEVIQVADSNIQQTMTSDSNKRQAW